MTEIHHPLFSVKFDSSSGCVSFKGNIRLPYSQDYEPIKTILFSSANSVKNGRLTLDFTKLASLNSSGIASISTFTIDMRRLNIVNLLIIGSKKSPWQEKTFNNLKKLWKDMELEFID